MPARCLLALACLTVQPAAQVASVAPPEQSVLRYAVAGLGVTFANPSFAPIPNAAAHQQDMVVDHAGWQYLAWWNQDRKVEVARRRRFAPSWESLVLPDYVLAGEDAHDTVNLGICPGDGTLHLAFDHHVSSLHYRVSVPGLAPSRYPQLPLGQAPADRAARPESRLEFLKRALDTAFIDL